MWNQTPSPATLIASRTAQCEDCGCDGTHVDTYSQDISYECGLVYVGDRIDTALMVDPDGELRCEECAGD